MYNGGVSPSPSTPTSMILATQEQVQASEQASSQSTVVSIHSENGQQSFSAETDMSSDSGSFQGSVRDIMNESGSDQASNRLSLSTASLALSPQEAVCLLNSAVAGTPSDTSLSIIPERAGSVHAQAQSLLGQHQLLQQGGEIPAQQSSGFFSFLPVNCPPVNCTTTSFRIPEGVINPVRWFSSLSNETQLKLKIAGGATVGGLAVLGVASAATYAATYEPPSARCQSILDSSNTSLPDSCNRSLTSYRPITTSEIDECALWIHCLASEKVPFNVTNEDIDMGLRWLEESKCNTSEPLGAFGNYTLGNELPTVVSTTAKNTKIEISFECKKSSNNATQAKVYDMKLESTVPITHNRNGTEDRTLGQELKGCKSGYSPNRASEKESIKLTTSHYLSTDGANSTLSTSNDTVIGENMLIGRYTSNDTTFHITNRGENVTRDGYLNELGKVFSEISSKEVNGFSNYQQEDGAYDLSKSFDDTLVGEGGVNKDPYCLVPTIKRMGEVADRDTKANSPKKSN